MDQREKDHTRSIPEPAVRACLERYLDGVATREDRDVVEAWAASDPANADLLRRIVRARRVAAAAPWLWDAEDAWARLKARLGTAPAPQVVPLRPRRQGWSKAALRAAAVVAIVAGVALWQNRAALFGPAEVPMREFAAGVGERVEVRLPDATRIVLGASSRLWVPEGYRDERHVRLEGEAVFDVAPDAERPFVVFTERAVTKVLGTRFGVTAFSEDTFVEVTVAEGRVGVLPTSEGPEPRLGAELGAGDAVRVQSDGTLGPVRKVDAESLLSWTTGGLAFDRATLAEVARTLERRYGFRITFDDPALAEVRLTADFGNAASATEIVELITRSLGLSARRIPDGFLLVQPVATAVSARAGERNR